MKKFSTSYRLMIKALKARQGDSRDWNEIKQWANTTGKDINYGKVAR